MNHPLPEQPLVQESLPNRPPLLNTKRMVFWFVSICAMLLLIGTLLLPATRNARPAAHRARCQNNLKHIELALQGYFDEHGQTPPLYTTDETGQPLHSWRTLLLPYMGRSDLYDQIDLSKPWDDPVHAKVRKAIPQSYVCETAKLKPGQTNYLANVPNWPARLWTNSPIPVGSNPDGTNVIVFEVAQAQAVEWMSPFDGHYLEFLANIDQEQSPLPHEGRAAILGVGGVLSFLQPNSDDFQTDQPKGSLNSNDE